MAAPSAARSAGRDAATRARARTIAAHLAEFRNPATRDGERCGDALAARLTLLFRRAMLDPAAAFIYLALVAQDGERLRGELVRRAALPGASAGRMRSR